MYHKFSRIAKEFSIYLVNVIGLTAVSSKEAKAILVPLEDHQRGTVEPSTSSSQTLTIYIMIMIMMFTLL